MPRRKQNAADETQPTQAQEAASPAAEPAQAAPEPPAPPRPLLADPFPFKTVNVGGAKLHFQHSRQAGEFQIRFGDGTEKEKPSDSIREFIKSHKVEVETTDGEKKEVQLFHWNGTDRAWGVRVDRDDPEMTRQTAKKIFDEVVKRVAAERETALEPSR
jgi:hypothetical protein